MRHFLLNNGVLLGLMIFSMTFGAGNLVLPLATGCFAGGQSFWGFLGFVLTSALIPYVGFLSSAMYRGDYYQLLSDNSHWVLASIITSFSMVLLALAIPRCIVTAHGALSLTDFFPKWMFIVGFMGPCYLFARNKSNLINLLAKILAPLTISCLMVMIFSGFLTPGNTASSGVSAMQAFMFGGESGLLTLDLLATVFYSRVICQLMMEIFAKLGKDPSRREFLRLALVGGSVAAVLFVVMYGGLTMIAGWHSGGIAISTKEHLLPGYSQLLLGSSLGFVQSLFVGLACFSTSFALLTVFSDYVVQVTNQRVSYQQALFLAALTSSFLATLDFTQISGLMSRAMILFYPFLVVIILFVFFKNIKRISE